MDYPVTLTVEYPDRLSRLTTFFRLFMLIPQTFVFIFISVAAWFIMFLSWWAILFIGRYPKACFDFMTWQMRSNTRFNAYMYLLTDKYPPFSGDDSTIGPQS